MNLNKMRKRVGTEAIFSLLLMAWSCDPSPTPSTGRSADFETIPQSFPITPGIIDEASGIAMSAGMAGYLWTIQDSGQPNSLYLISPDGKAIKQFPLPGTVNHDWEDLAVGVGPKADVSYMYVADIGNNNAPMTATNIIYRIPEVADMNGSFKQSDLEKITFKYPDGARDAETILVDPITKDVFIISKETDKTGIYRLASPQSVTETITAEKVGSIPSVFFTTGGNISVDGNEILVRTYLAVYYWQRKTGETVGQTLIRTADKQLTVAFEPQGEAVSFDRKADGFYTLSEKGTANGVSLNYYKRK